MQEKQEEKQFNRNNSPRRKSNTPRLRPDNNNWHRRSSYVSPEMRGERQETHGPNFQRYHSSNVRGMRNRNYRNELQIREERENPQERRMWRNFQRYPEVNEEGHNGQRWSHCRNGLSQGVRRNYSEWIKPFEDRRGRPLRPINHRRNSFSPDPRRRNDVRREIRYSCNPGFHPKERFTKPDRNVLLHQCTAYGNCYRKNPNQKQFPNVQPRSLVCLPCRGRENNHQAGNKVPPQNRYLGSMRRDNLTCNCNGDCLSNFKRCSCCIRRLRCSEQCACFRGNHCRNTRNEAQARNFQQLRSQAYILAYSEQNV